MPLWAVSREEGLLGVLGTQQVNSGGRGATPRETCSQGQGRCHAHLILAEHKGMASVGPNIFDTWRGSIFSFLLEK